MAQATTTTTTIAHAAKDLAAHAVRLNNDANGNPRYYIERAAWLTALEDAGYTGEISWSNAPDMPECPKYRGKQYGAGYVLRCCYHIPRDCERALERALKA